MRGKSQISKSNAVREMNSDSGCVDEIVAAVSSFLLALKTSHLRVPGNHPGVHWPPVAPARCWLLLQLIIALSAQKLEWIQSQSARGSFGGAQHLIKFVAGKSGAGRM